MKKETICLYPKAMQKSFLWLVLEWKSERFDVWKGSTCWLLVGKWRDTVRWNVNAPKNRVMPEWHPARKQELQSYCHKDFVNNLSGLKTDCSPEPPIRACLANTDFWPCESLSRKPIQGSSDFWPIKLWYNKGNCSRWKESKKTITKYNIQLGPRL